MVGCRRHATLMAGCRRQALWSVLSPHRKAIWSVPKAVLGGRPPLISPHPPLRPIRPWVACLSSAALIIVANMVGCRRQATGWVGGNRAHRPIRLRAGGMLRIESFSNPIAPLQGNYDSGGWETIVPDRVPGGRR